MTAAPKLHEFTRHDYIVCIRRYDGTYKAAGIFHGTHKEVADLALDIRDKKKTDVAIFQRVAVMEWRPPPEPAEIPDSPPL